MSIPSASKALIFCEDAGNRIEPTKIGFCPTGGRCEQNALICIAAPKQMVKKITICVGSVLARKLHNAANFGIA